MRDDKVRKRKCVICYHIWNDSTIMERLKIVKQLSYGGMNGVYLYILCCIFLSIVLQPHMSLKQLN